MRTPSIDTLIDVAENHGLHVDWHRGGPKGAWLPPDTISIRVGMTDAETLSALAHELGHFANTDPCGDDPRAEARADRHAARILIDPDDYAVAEAVYGPCLPRIAAELGVTQHLATVWRDTYERTPMICPQCSSENVTIQLAQTKGKSKHQGTGFGGHTNNAARTATAMITLGTSNLFWKKSKGGSKTKFTNEKMAVCQSCGNSWTVK